MTNRFSVLDLFMCIHCYEIIVYANTGCSEYYAYDTI